MAELPGQVTFEQAENVAASSMGFLALDFACQPETWPVFVRWVNSRTAKKLSPACTRETAIVLVDVLAERMHRGE